MGLFSKFIAKVRGTGDLNASDWKDFEEELLLSDLGPTLTQKVIDQARKVKSENVSDAISQVLTSNLSTKAREISLGQTTTVIMVIGVNGTGKTTSVAKLAAKIKNSGKSVVIAAGDTFRAAAEEQLQTWGTRIGVEVVSGKVNGDPASVAFDAAKKAQELKSDYLIIDTAGRLHNKTDLMAELEKVKRVVEKVFPVNETLLVIDATTGQNGLAQAKIFTQAVQTTGIILTKLDGSARGGVALAIESELDIPIKWVGTGESEVDFAPFEPSHYLQGLLA
jgi:fused signal recognition particle receptor